MRFTETDTAGPGQMEFVPRKRQDEIWKILRAVALATVVVGLLVLAPGGAYKNLGAVVAVVVVAILGLYVVYEKQRSIDTMMAAEFQNLLFSQVASLGSSFCLFARRDGTIVHADDGLRKIFKHFVYTDAMALEGLFEQGGVAKADRERLINALYSGASDRLIFPIPGEDDEQKEYVLTVEPLVRPGGFAVIRGREFHALRKETQMMPEALRVISGSKLDHLLGHSSVPQFIADPYGRLEYVTPSLELMLGYTPGEVTEKRLSVRHLLYQLNGQSVPEDYTVAEYHTLGILKKKSGLLQEVTLEISLMRDAEGKLLGATGSMAQHQPQQA